MHHKSTPQSANAIIIGSGVAGLAAAIRLANQGFKVQVYEANDYAGGKMYEWSKDGFRFDMGPSVFTMPEYIEELFRLSGKDPSDYLQWDPLESTCRHASLSIL